MGKGRYNSILLETINLFFFFFISDINIKSPYCKRIQCEFNEKWQTVFPELNFLHLNRKFFLIKIFFLNNIIFRW